MWLGRGKANVADDSPQYPGHCAICGANGVFGVSAEQRSVDHEFRCAGCKQFLRFRDEAQVLIDEFGDGRQLCLDDLVAGARVRSLRIYHVGSTGPIRARLSRVPEYVESRFDPDAALGDVLADGFVNQDLQRLSFADDEFDLVVSSHVMEHVPDPWLAFAEVARVLRPGGRMIHSIPTRFPLPDATVARASMVDGETVNHLEARFHRSPEGADALVYSDFGADVAGRLADLGFDVSVRRPHLQIDAARRNVVLVGRVMSPPRTTGEEERDGATPRP